MGNDCTTPLPPLPSPNYMIVGSYFSDALVLIYGGKSEVDAVRNNIITHWPEGIQREKYKCEEDKENPKHFNCLKIKMKGYPFSAVSGKADAIRVRRLAAGIMHTLYNLGWVALCSSDLSRTADLATWVFQRQVVQPNPIPMFSIGLSSTDKLQINDCPEELHSVIRQVVEQDWVNGIQSEEKEDGTYEIKMNGNPWSYVSKEESCSARKMLKNLIQRLTGRQYDLYLNTNLKGNADTLLFQHRSYLQGEAEFVVLSLNRNDRLRMLDVSDSICNMIKEVVEQWWPRGIQDVIVDPYCFELKLKGHPWWADGEEAAHSRRLITKIMERLASIGYYIMSGIDITRKDNDKSLLLFRRGVPLSVPFMCLSLNQTDYVRFICAPQNVVDAGAAIVRQWPMGLEENRNHYEGVNYEAKLKGNPWSAIMQGDGLYGRAMLLGLLCTFNSLGWRLVCSGDVSAKFVHQDKGPDYPLDVHSWWFMYDETLLASLPPPEYTPPPEYAPPSSEGIYPELPGQ